MELHERALEEVMNVSNMEQGCLQGYLHTAANGQRKGQLGRWEGREAGKKAGEGRGRRGRGMAGPRGLNA